MGGGGQVNKHTHAQMDIVTYRLNWPGIQSTLHHRQHKPYSQVLVKVKEITNNVYIFLGNGFLKQFIGVTKCS